MFRLLLRTTRPIDQFRTSIRYYSQSSKPNPPTTYQRLSEQFSESFTKISKQVNDSPTTQDIYELFKEMERRRYNLRKVKWIAGGVGATLVILSGKQIKSFLSSQTSEVTTQSMDDPEFQNRVTELSHQVSKEVLESLLANDQLQKTVQTYTKQVLEQAVVDLYRDSGFMKETEQMVADVITSEMMSEKSGQLAKQVANELLADENLQVQTGQHLKNACYYGLFGGSGNK